MKRLFSVLFFMFCAAVCSAAENPVGVLDNFSVDTVSQQLPPVLIGLLVVVGTVWGTVLGFAFLKWVYWKIRDALNDRANDKWAREHGFR